MIASAHEKLPRYKERVYAFITKGPQPILFTALAAKITGMNLKIPIGDLVQQYIGNSFTGTVFILSRITPEGNFDPVLSPGTEG